MKVRDPLLPPALGLGAGLLLSPVFDLTYGQAGLACVFFIWATLLSRYRQVYFVGVALFVGFLLERASRPGSEPELDAASGETVLLAGCVVEPPAFSEGRQQFVLELAEGARARVTFYPREGEQPPDLQYGQTIEVEAKIRKPRNFGNPGAFDYRGYLARRQIYWTASVRAGAAPTILPGACGHRATAFIFAIRRGILDRTEALFRGNAYATALHQALLIGESSKLERVWVDDYRRTGTYHALVVSGLHVSVIAGLTVMLFRLLFLGHFRARALAVALVWLYAWICLWQAPVVRAAGGFTFYVAGTWAYRRSRVLNLLGAVAVVFLLTDPIQSAEGSFQLTFLSMLALGALAAPAVDALTSKWRLAFRDLADPFHDAFLRPEVAQFRIELRLLAETLRLTVPMPEKATLLACRVMLGWIAVPLCEAMLVSAVVQVGLALPLIYYFHRVSFTALLVNPVVTLLLTAAVPLGFAGVVTMWWPLASLGSGLVEIARRLTQAAVDWEPVWRIPDPPLWLAALFVLTMALLALHRERWLVLPALALLGVIIWHPFVPEASGELELSMIDVGQGDSLLVGSPDGHWMVVDGGGIPVFRKDGVKSRLDIGEDVVTPYLLSRAIRRVEVLANTHQHEDHAGGLLALLENFRPRELWLGAAPESEISRALLARAGELGVPVRFLRRGDTVSLGSLPIEVVSPGPNYQTKSTPHNNDSLALRLHHGAHRFLLTGDIERTTEFELLDQDLQAQVLKVPHHGSRTSSTDPFLERVQPLFALISAGQENLFRHPHKEVLGRLEQRHSQILRTDQMGLITIRTNGRRFTVETHGRAATRQPLLFSE